MTTSIASTEFRSGSSRRTVTYAALAAALAFVSACAAGDDDPKFAGEDEAIQSHPNNEVSAPACRGAETIARPDWTGTEYENPVVPFFGGPEQHGCPDPSVGWDPSRHEYFMYCTSYDHPYAFPIFESSDLSHWNRAPDQAMFPGRDRWPSWVHRPYLFWAPNVFHRGDGVYLTYYAAQCASGHQCIGVARTRDPATNWYDHREPLINDSPHGSIDPNLFRDDDGRMYLYYVHQAGTIVVRELTRDGLSILHPHEPPHEIAWAGGSADTSWEERVNEGPFVVRHGDHYYLFYSGASYLHSYAVGVARSTSPFGPFVKRGPPILHGDEHWLAPGGNSIFRHDGRDFIVYHAIARHNPQITTEANGVCHRSNPPGVEYDPVRNPYCRRQDDRQAMIDPIVWDPDPCVPGAYWPRVPGDVPSFGRVHLP